MNKIKKEITFVKDFLWGTFNRRNKGMPLIDRPKVGWTFAVLQQKGKRKIE